jgi:hypothetical protein
VGCAKERDVCAGFGLVEDPIREACVCPPGTMMVEDRCELPDGGLDASIDARTEDVGCRSYRDTDRDGFGDPNDIVRECPPPTGYVSQADDCDDSRADASPDAAETCNGLDDDCDGDVDETFECPQGMTNVPCTTSCGSTGLGICGATCTIDSCAPSMESCSYMDDDCDGEVDEDLQRLVPSREFGSSTAALRTWTFGGEAPVVFTLYSGGLWLAQRFTADGEPMGSEVEVYSVALTPEAEFGISLVFDVAQVGDDGYVLLVPNATRTELVARRIGSDFTLRGTVAITSTARGAAIAATATNILVGYVTDEGVLWLRAMDSALVAQAPTRVTSDVFPLVSVAARLGSSDAWVSYTDTYGLRLQKVRSNNGNTAGPAIVVDPAMQRWFPTMAWGDEGTLGLLYAQGVGDVARLNFQVRDGIDGSLMSTQTLPDPWELCAYTGVPFCRPSDVVWSGSRWLVSHFAGADGAQETRLRVYGADGEQQGEALVLARSADQFRMSSSARLRSGVTLLTIPTPGRPRYALFGCPR